MAPIWSGPFHFGEESIECGSPAPLFRWWLVTNRESGSQASALQTSRKLNRKNKFPPPLNKRGASVTPGRLSFLSSVVSPQFSATKMWKVRKFAGTLRFVRPGRHSAGCGLSKNESCAREAWSSPQCLAMMRVMSSCCSWGLNRRTSSTMATRADWEDDPQWRCKASMRRSSPNCSSAES